MSIQLRLLHRALRLFSDYLMLPLFGLLGETRDSVLGGCLCVLYTVGRKSGQPREIPLNYARSTQGLLIMAGFGRSTGWVHNLRARPRAQVLVGSEMRSVVAVEVTDREQAREVVRAVLKNSGAMGFFYGWDPRRASDEQIQKIADGLVCFHLRDASVAVGHARLRP